MCYLLRSWNSLSLKRRYLSEAVFKWSQISQNAAAAWSSVHYQLLWQLLCHHLPQGMGRRNGQGDGLPPVQQHQGLPLGRCYQLLPEGSWSFAPPDHNRGPDAVHSKHSDLPSSSWRQPSLVDLRDRCWSERGLAVGHQLQHQWLPPCGHLCLGPQSSYY